MNIFLRILPIILISAILWLPAGCNRNSEYDDRLARIADTVSDYPEEALHALDSIDYDALSAENRHFYDFLIIKARDKAFIMHKSDSLILDVIKYYSKRSADSLYAEALYYGGRTYDDLGDVPTALGYYTKALENIKSVSTDSDLPSRINSQRGLLLHNLRLYDEALDCYDKVLNEAIGRNDSLGIVLALQRMGSICCDAKRYPEADSLLSRSMDYAASLPREYTAKSRVSLAAVKQAQGHFRQALNLIRNTPDSVKPLLRNVALAFAAEIYLQSGITDTAFIYAHDLIMSDDNTNKKTGYNLILSPELRSRLSPESLNQYYNEYNDILETSFDENSNELALMQESQYNYNIHEQKRIEVQKYNEKLKFIIFGCIFLVFLLAFAILYLKYRNKVNIIKLRAALDNITLLKQRIDTSGNNDCDDKPDTNIIIPASIDDEKVLRDCLRKELLELSNTTDAYKVPENIRNSDVYAEIQTQLDAGLPVADNLWGKIERMVLTSSPNFKSNLRLLTQGKISSADLHIALLIKCGFRPCEITVLLARTNGAIISRRETLGIKMLDRKTGVKVIDNIIRRL